MEKYTISRAVPGDEAALAMIQNISWQHAFKTILDEETLAKCTNREKTTAMYRRLLDEKLGYGYLLRVEGEPHCIAWWNTARDPSMTGYAELICIHSMPERWHRGYGSKMMETVLRDMKEAGYEKVMLWVFKDNMRARGFYEAHGFTTEERQKPGIDPVEICYERML